MLWILLSLQLLLLCIYRILIKCKGLAHSKFETMAFHIFNPKTLEISNPYKKHRSFSQEPNSELSPILSTLFNCWPKNKAFPDPGTVSCIYPVNKNEGTHSSLSKYRHISFLRIISKLFNAIINKKFVNHIQIHKLVIENRYGPLLIS